MNSFNIIGIDPGNNLGVSILTIDSKTFNIINIRTHIFVLEDYSSSIILDKKISKLYYITNVIPSYLYNLYNPKAIGIETAFLNTRFPKAVMHLSQYVGNLDLSFRSLDSFIKIFKYPPKYIKGIISTGDANKNDMLIGISKIKELKDILDYSKLTEHEIDAIAIAYVTLQEIRKYPLVLCSII